MTTYITQGSQTIHRRVNGKDADSPIVINLTRDSGSVQTDENGTVVGAYPTTTAQLYEGGILKSGVVWSCVCTNCSATISTAGVVTISSITGGTSVKSATVLIKGLYKGNTYDKAFVFEKTFGKAQFWLELTSDAIVYDPNNNVYSPSEFMIKAWRLLNGDKREITQSSGIGYILFNKQTTRHYSGESGSVSDFVSTFGKYEEGLLFEVYSINGVLQAFEHVPVMKHGINGTSVLAQWSSGQDSEGEWNWHGSWQTGDIFMRTSSDGGTTWEGPFRVVGEEGQDGDYTDFKFNISKSTTNTYSFTAPAECYYSTWQTNPVKPTTAYPYLWVQIVKVTHNSAGQEFRGTARYIRLTGEKGADGTSVSIKGKVDDFIYSVPEGQGHVDNPVYATQQPSGITRWDEMSHEWVSSTPSVGDGYLVNDLYGNRISDQNQGHLLVWGSAGWVDAGVIKGDPGDPTYLHIAYANSADGTTDFTTDDNLSDGKKYIGTYVDKFQTDSEDPADYSWKRFRGADGVSYDLYASVQTIQADYSGTVKTGAIEVSAWRWDGDQKSNQLLSAFTIQDQSGSVVAHYLAQYSIDGGLWQDCGQISIVEGMTAKISYGVPAAKVRNVTKGIDIRLKHSSDQNKVLKTIPQIQVVKDGQPGASIQGIQGMIVRTSEWGTGIEYHNDKTLTDDVRYLDVVTITNQNTGDFDMWECLLTHYPSSADNKPSASGDNQYWKKLNKQTRPIYTPLIIADQALLRFTQTNQLLVMKSDGVTVNVGLGGGTYPLWIGSTQAGVYQDGSPVAPFQVKENGEFWATNAHIRGEIIATSGQFSGKIIACEGTIGGFEIGSNYIKSDGSATLQIGGTNFNTKFGLTSETKSVRVNGGINEIILTNYNFAYKENNRFVLKNTTSGSYDWQNIGVANVMNIDYFKSTSATTQAVNNYGFQFAMLGSGHIVMDAIVEGCCYDRILFTAAYKVTMMRCPLFGNRIDLYSLYDNDVVVLPDLYSMFSTLGCGIINTKTGQKFTFRIDFFNSGSKTVYIVGYNEAQINNKQALKSVCLPYLRYRGSLYSSNLTQIGVKPQYIVSVMLTYDGGNYSAHIINQL